MILDVAVILILLLFLFFGIRTGLVRMALRFGSTLFSILVAWMGYPFASEWLSRFWLKDLSEFIRVSYIEPNMSGILNNAEGIPDFLRSVIQSGTDTVVHSAAQSIADSAAELLLNVAAFLMVFLLGRMIVLLVTRMLNLITRLPLIKQCNKLGGGFLGLLEGALSIYLVLALVFLIPSIRDSEGFRQQMQESHIAKQMYLDNVIIKIAAPNSGAEQSEGGAEVDR